MTSDRAGGDEVPPPRESDGLPSDSGPIADGGSPESRLFDAFPDPLLCYEGAADAPVVRRVNPAYERAFDVDGATLAGDPVADRLLAIGVEIGPGPDGTDREDFETGQADDEETNTEDSANDVLSRLDEGEPVTVTTGRGGDGEPRFFRLRAVPLPGADDSTCLVYTEVTGLQRRLRSLETGVERLERLIGVAAHDLRNPLEVAKIRLEAARDTGDDVHYEKADAALDRIQSIVRDALSVGGAELDASRGVALGAVAEAAWSTVDTDDAALVRGDDLPTISADRDLLQRLFENLFRNAVEHGSSGNRPANGDAAERGGRNLTVTVGRLRDGFYVADDGRGVPSGDRDRVFDPGFSTADDNAGLGLAIVTQIAEDHGWTVGLTAAETGGARFEFTGIESDDSP